MIHEDDRRILEDWPEAKFITAKTDCILGDHYHKVKTEKFILIKGQCIAGIGMDFITMQIGRLYTIEPNIRHTFELTAGSILIGICSHAYDPNDDYK